MLKGVIGCSVLAHLGLVTHSWVNWLDHRRTRCSVRSHYSNRCQLKVNRTPKNKLPEISVNMKIFLSGICIWKCRLNTGGLFVQFYIYIIICCNVKTHPCPRFNSGLAKLMDKYTLCITMAVNIYFSMQRYQVTSVNSLGPGRFESNLM